MTNCLGETTLTSTGNKVYYKKKTTLGKVTDGFPLKRSLKSSVVYRVIKKMKSTVIITSDHSRLSFELPKNTIVYVYA